MINTNVNINYKNIDIYKNKINEIEKNKTIESENQVSIKSKKDLIKEQIENGTYKFDIEKTSKSLLDVLI